MFGAAGRTGEDRPFAGLLEQSRSQRHYAALRLLGDNRPASRVCPGQWLRPRIRVQFEWPHHVIVKAIDWRRTIGRPARGGIADYLAHLLRLGVASTNLLKHFGCCAAGCTVRFQHLEHLGFGHERRNRPQATFTSACFLLAASIAWPCFCTSSRCASSAWHWGGRGAGDGAGEASGSVPGAPPNCAAACWNAIPTITVANSPRPTIAPLRQPIGRARGPFH
jgi:hypothetical protein